MNHAVVFGSFTPQTSTLRLNTFDFIQLTAMLEEWSPETNIRLFYFFPAIPPFRLPITDFK